MWRQSSSAEAPWLVRQDEGEQSRLAISALKEEAQILVVSAVISPCVLINNHMRREEEGETFSLPLDLQLHKWEVILWDQETPPQSFLLNNQQQLHVLQQCVIIFFCIMVSW